MKLYVIALYILQLITFGVTTLRIEYLNNDITRMKAQLLLIEQKEKLLRLKEIKEIKELKDSSIFNQIYNCLTLESGVYVLIGIGGCAVIGFGIYKFFFSNNGGDDDTASVISDSVLSLVDSAYKVVKKGIHSFNNTHDIVKHINPDSVKPFTGKGDTLGNGIGDSLLAMIRKNEGLKIPKDNDISPINMFHQIEDSANLLLNNIDSQVMSKEVSSMFQSLLEN